MIKSKFKIAFSLFMAVILAFSCLSVMSFAETLTIIKQPTNRSFYQGIDWSYSKDKTVSVIHTPDLAGTVLSNGKKQVAYQVSKWPNMYCQPSSGKWVAGKNTIKIYCDDFSGYATTTINFVEVDSISIVTPPSNTVFVKGLDWNSGPLGDVEFTSCNLTGLSIKVKYTDGTSKTLSYPDNQLIGWSVPENTAYIMPGDAALDATFCGKRASFPVTFAATNPFALGDATKDGQINSADALVILRHATGIVTLDYSAARLADVNKDKNINSYDALLVLQYSVGSIKGF
ncbi:MAG: dockerin type I repeat-containing protein [Clostridia bacterium]|nr:dockerin type I repeat-containing protein [Clostridia bacterium]